MLAGARELWTNFARLQMSFASESGEEKSVCQEVVDEKILLPVSGTLPCHGTFEWYGREREGVGGNRKESDNLIMRGRNYAGA
jgi:hypothetical protein